MRVLHDLICDQGHRVRDVMVETSVDPSVDSPYGLCKKCMAPYKICWLHGKAPGTDVLGHEVTSEVLGISYTSTRDRDQQMKRRGFEPADKIRGGPMTQSNHLPKRIGGDGRARFGGDA